MLAGFAEGTVLSLIWLKFKFVYTLLAGFVEGTVLSQIFL